MERNHQTQQISRQDVTTAMSYIDENRQQMPDQVFVVLCNLLRNEHMRQEGNQHVDHMQLFHMRSMQGNNNRIISTLSDTNRILATTIAKQMEILQTQLPATN